ncbi:MAG: fluoride efflux transporter FluC [Planctomycetaceae bacterium]
MNHLSHVLLLATAGAAGTLLRVGVTTSVARFVGHAFPWGTLVVNVAGSFAFGAVWAWSRSRGLAVGTETILLAGLLGGFTTYSSFAFQSAEMLHAGRTPAAVGYVAATTLAGLAAIWAGIRCFR